MAAARDSGSVCAHVAKRIFYALQKLLNKLPLVRHHRKAAAACGKLFGFVFQGGKLSGLDVVV